MVLRRISIHFFLSLFIALSSQSHAAQEESKIIKAHAISMHGTPKYPEDFERFEYTSPNAIKGGELRLDGTGTFDSLNGFISKGTVAGYTGLLYDTLTTGSSDEPFTNYGLVAKTIEYPEDRSWVTYHLNPNARFHDGKPITAEDVAFTFNLLTEEGNPFYKFYYADVSDIQIIDDLTIKFVFRENYSKETVLILGDIPILPKHYWKDRDFNKTSLEIPLGSGPYTVAKIDPGRSITYKRVENYWAEDHPTHKGLYNFDQIRIDYYRDDTVALEAFKAGEYDYRYETSSKVWATAYTGQALESREMIKEEISHQNPTGMQAYIFNLRKPLFQDIELRKAVGLVFDFEWSNTNLFYGTYTRTKSFFSNSDLASSGLPSPEELKLLDPFREQLPDSVFSEVYEPAVSDGKGQNRKNLRKAKQILDSAGYNIIDGELYSPSEEPVKFEILMFQTGFERIHNPFIQALKRLGINVSLRVVDVSQYVNRLRELDFDMITHTMSQSLSPGNEQRDYWGSEAAKASGSRNLMGIANPVIDHLIEVLIQAKTREELLTATHALDRVLLHMHYVIPQWSSRSHRIAYWNKFNRPETAPIYDVRYSTGLMTWWAKPETLEKP